MKLFFEKDVRGKNQLTLVLLILALLPLLYVVPAKAVWVDAGVISGMTCDSMYTPPESPIPRVFGEYIMSRCIDQISNGNLNGTACRVIQSEFASGDPYCQGKAWVPMGCSSNQFELNGRCVEPEAPNLGPPKRCEGTNPINVLTGNKYQAVTDYTGSGTTPISVKRFYNSNLGRWQHNLNGLEFFSLKNIDYGLPGGYIAYVSTYGAIYTLIANPPEYFTFSNLNGKRFHMASNGNDTFTGINNPMVQANIIRDADNKIQEIIINSGTSEAWQFDAQGRLGVYSNDRGVTHTYSYSPNNTISIVHNITNETVEAILNDDGSLAYLNLPNSQTINYSYDGLGRLVSVASSYASEPMVYHYENPDFPNALTGVTGEDGKRFAMWQYDATGRAISSTHESYETVAINYQFVDDPVDARVTVTNALNKKNILHITKINGESLLTFIEGQPSTNCAAANQYKSYYPNATLQTQTDWEGNVTYFERDTLGRTIKKTAGLKWPGTPQYGLNVGASTLQTTANTKITQTCWHATHNKPERTIEPGRVTIYDYFDNGQIKNKKVEKRTAANEQCLP